MVLPVHIVLTIYIETFSDFQHKPNNEKVTTLFVCIKTSQFSTLHLNFQILIFNNKDYILFYRSLLLVQKSRRYSWVNFDYEFSIFTTHDTNR